MTLLTVLSPIVLIRIAKTGVMSPAWEPGRPLRAGQPPEPPKDPVIKTVYRGDGGIVGPTASETSRENLTTVTAVG